MTCETHNTVSGHRVPRIFLKIIFIIQKFLGSMAAHCRCLNDYLTTHVIGWIVSSKNSHTVKIQVALLPNSLYLERGSLEREVIKVK